MVKQILGIGYFVSRRRLGSPGKGFLAWHTVIAGRTQQQMKSAQINPNHENLRPYFHPNPWQS